MLITYIHLTANCIKLQEM